MTWVEDDRMVYNIYEIIYVTHKKKLGTLESSKLDWPTLIPAAKFSQNKNNDGSKMLLKI